MGLKLSGSFHELNEKLKKIKRNKKKLKDEYLALRLQIYWHKRMKEPSGIK